jgi:hypothetical protein
MFDSSAIAEYHLTKDLRTPTRIFEKALETFTDEVDLVSHYLGFLLSINDENSELLVEECHRYSLIFHRCPCTFRTRHRNLSS